MGAAFVMNSLGLGMFSEPGWNIFIRMILSSILE
jgi:hypothetical protein